MMISFAVGKGAIVSVADSDNCGVANWVTVISGIEVTVSLGATGEISFWGCVVTQPEIIVKITINRKKKRIFGNFIE
jgi:hypothetical protein